MAQEEVGFIDSTQTKQKKESKVRNFCRSIFNPEKGELFGRTASSWAKITIFYLIFYSCLAGFFAIMLMGFFSTLSDKEPTQQRMYSLIKANPGMGFRPRPNIESTLIKFDASDPESYAEHIKSIEDIINDYRNHTDKEIDCNPTTELKYNEVCKFNISVLGTNCSFENDYGYKIGKPCVLLKINKVFDWSPKAFDDSITDEEVNKRYETAKTLFKGNISSVDIGITCEGENDGDVDNIGQTIFYPTTGFPFYFYPYKNQENYHSPLVFVQFDNPRPGILIQVWCKLWAANIKHHKNDKAGSTHFELLVDNKN